MDRWDRLDAAADELDRLAARAGVLVAPAERLAGPDTWIGPAADDALLAVGWATRRAGEAAVALRRLAARLRAEAAEGRARDALLAAPR